MTDNFVDNLYNFITIKEWVQKMVARNFVGQIVFWFVSVGCIVYALRLGLTLNSLLTEKSIYTLGFTSHDPKWKILFSEYIIFYPFFLFVVTLAFIAGYLWKKHPNSNLKKISLFILGTAIITCLTTAGFFGEVLAS